MRRVWRELLVLTGVLVLCGLLIKCEIDLWDECLADHSWFYCIRTLKNR